MYSHLAVLRLAVAGGLLFHFPPTLARGATVTIDLVCVLDDPGICSPGPSFGTVTLTDTAPNTVRIDVGLFHANLLFANMMFHVSGIAGLIFNFTEPVVNPLALGTYSIAPNPAEFNLGSPDNPPGAVNGWDGASGYVGVIQATGLSTASFVANNAGAGQYHAALQIINAGPGACSGSADGSTDCVPGQQGSGTLSLGGLRRTADEPVPEPWSLGLVGAGLMAVSMLGRRVRW